MGDIGLFLCGPNPPARQPEEWRLSADETAGDQPGGPIEEL